MSEKQCRQMARWATATSQITMQTKLFAKYTTIMQRKLSWNRSTLTEKTKIDPMWLSALEVGILPNDKVETIREKIENAFPITFDQFNQMNPGILLKLVLSTESDKKEDSIKRKNNASQETAIKKIQKKPAKT